MQLEKTFIPLSETMEPTEKCSTVMTNRMPCWRAADVLVTKVEKVTDDKKKVTETVTKYQLCLRHALAEQQEYYGSQGKHKK